MFCMFADLGQFPMNVIRPHSCTRFTDGKPSQAAVLIAQTKGLLADAVSLSDHTHGKCNYFTFLSNWP